MPWPTSASLTNSPDPYRPQSNGKVERVQPDPGPRLGLPADVCQQPGPTVRPSPSFLDRYSHQRSHSALGGQPLSGKPGVPLCLSSRLWSGSVGAGSLSFVGEHEPPDTRRDLAFEASHCCFVGLTLADLAVVVAPPRAVTHPDLGNSDEMQSRVQFPIPAARQAMDSPLPGGDLYRSDAGIVGERVGAGKPRSPSAAADETNRQHRSDTVDLKQPASIVLEGFGHLGGDRLQSSIYASDLPDQVPCQRLAGRLWRCLGTDLAEKRPCCVGLERRRRTARNQVSQQGMELVDRPDPLSRQVRPPLLQQSEHHCYVLGNDYRSVTVKRCNTRGRSSVDHVVLTSPAPRQLTHPGGRGGRRVKHHLVLGHKPPGRDDSPDPGRSPPPNVAPRTDAPNPTAAGNRQWWHQLAPTTPTCSSPRPLP